eukprot:439651_1
MSEDVQPEMDESKNLDLNEYKSFEQFANKFLNHQYAVTQDEFNTIKSRTDMDNYSNYKNAQKHAKKQYDKALDDMATNIKYLHTKWFMDWDIASIVANHMTSRYKYDKELLKQKSNIYPNDEPNLRTKLRNYLNEIHKESEDDEKQRHLSTIRKQEQEIEKLRLELAAFKGKSRNLNYQISEEKDINQNDEESDYPNAQSDSESEALLQYSAHPITQFQYCVIQFENEICICLILNIKRKLHWRNNKKKRYFNTNYETNDKYPVFIDVKINGQFKEFVLMDTDSILMCNNDVIGNEHNKYQIECIQQKSIILQKHGTNEITTIPIGRNAALKRFADDYKVFSQKRPYALTKHSIKNVETVFINLIAKADNGTNSKVTGDEAYYRVVEGYMFCLQRSNETQFKLVIQLFESILLAKLLQLKTKIQKDTKWQKVFCFLKAKYNISDNFITEFNATRKIFSESLYAQQLQFDSLLKFDVGLLTNRTYKRALNKFMDDDDNNSYITIDELANDRGFLLEERDYELPSAICTGLKNCKIFVNDTVSNPWFIANIDDQKTNWNLPKLKIQLSICIDGVSYEKELWTTGNTKLGKVASLTVAALRTIRNRKKKHRHEPRAHHANAWIMAPESGDITELLVGHFNSSVKLFNDCLDEEIRVVKYNKNKYVAELDINLFTADTPILSKVLGTGNQSANNFTIYIQGVYKCNKKNVFEWSFEFFIEMRTTPKVIKWRSNDTKNRMEVITMSRTIMRKCKTFGYPKPGIDTALLGVQFFVSKTVVGARNKAARTVRIRNWTKMNRDQYIEWLPSVYTHDKHINKLPENIYTDMVDSNVPLHWNNNRDITKLIQSISNRNKTVKLEIKNVQYDATTKISVHVTGKYVDENTVDIIFKDRTVGIDLSNSTFDKGLINIDKSLADPMHAFGNVVSNKIYLTISSLPCMLRHINEKLVKQSLKDTFSWKLGHYYQHKTTAITSRQMRLGGGKKQLFMWLHGNLVSNLIRLNDQNYIWPDDDDDVNDEKKHEENVERILMAPNNFWFRALKMLLHAVGDYFDFIKYTLLKTRNFALNGWIKSRNICIMFVEMIPLTDFFKPADMRGFFELIINIFVLSKNKENGDLRLVDLCLQGFEHFMKLARKTIEKFNNQLDEDALPEKILANFHWVNRNGRVIDELKKKKEYEANDAIGIIDIEDLHVLFDDEEANENNSKEFDKKYLGKMSSPKIRQGHYSISFIIEKKVSCTKCGSVIIGFDGVCYDCLRKPAEEDIALLKYLLFYTSKELNTEYKEKLEIFKKKLGNDMNHYLKDVLGHFISIDDDDDD